MSPPSNLAYSKTYFWHVRALDPTTVGPWAQTQAFVTPAQVVTPPPGGGGGCGAAATDVLCQATILNSPPALASWPATSTITSVSFDSSGFPVEFDKRLGAGRWPDSPFGDGLGGTIQYTL